DSDAQLGHGGASGRPYRLGTRACRSRAEAVRKPCGSPRRRSSGPTAPRPREATPRRRRREVTTSPIHRDPAGGETVVPRSRPIRGAAVGLGVAVLIGASAHGATHGSGGGAPQTRL